MILSRFFILGAKILPPPCTFIVFSFCLQLLKDSQMIEKIFGQHFIGFMCNLQQLQTIIEIFEYTPQDILKIAQNQRKIMTFQQVSYTSSKNIATGVHNCTSLVWLTILKMVLKSSEKLLSNIPQMQCAILNCKST